MGGLDLVLLLTSQDAAEAARMAALGLPPGQAAETGADALAEAGLVNLVLAIGALGVAAYGLVDIIRTLPFGRAWGFSRIRRDLDILAPVLTAAYGPDWLTLIREQYIDGRAKGDALETIRQGVRAGLTLEGGHASESWNGRLAAFSGAVTPEQLDALRQALRQNETMPDDQEAVFSRFELAMDLRLRAAFAEADRRFRADAIRWACAIAILLSVIGFALVYQVSSIADFFSVLPLALIVGVVAVPLAPVSKDLASAISAAAHAARAARGR